MKVPSHPYYTRTGRISQQIILPIILRICSRTRTPTGW